MSPFLKRAVAAAWLLAGVSAPALAASPDFLSSAQGQEILSAVAEKGSAKVIVMLDMPGGAFAAGDDEAANQAFLARVDAVQDGFLARIADTGKSSVMRRYENFAGFALSVDRAALDAIVRDGGVASIDAVRLEAPTNLDVSTAYVNAPTAWNANYNGQGQVVAVLDGGTQVSHPFFSGKIVDAACFSTTNATDGSRSTCTGGASSAFGLNSINCAAGGGVCDHGSHVAGITAGKNPNATGTPRSGVARDAQILAVQIFSRFDNPAICGSAAATPCILSYNSDSIAATDWVLSQRNRFPIASLNMSFGGGRFFTQAACDAANQARVTVFAALRANNIAPVASSGNDSRDDSGGAPACVSTAIAVGSSVHPGGSTNFGIDTVSTFSNNAAWVQFLAPGNSILSAVNNNGYAALSGTSMAAPHVSGAFAVLASAAPNSTLEQRIAALRNGGRNLNYRTGTEAVYNVARIDLAGAVDSLLGRPQAMLSVSTLGTGMGTVTSSTGGINCSLTSFATSVAAAPVCTASVQVGTSVTLTANPAPGVRFAGWSGDCAASATNPLTNPRQATVTMSGPRSCTAIYNKTVGDMLGNGKANLLWRHSATGQLVLWELNGQLRLSSTTNSAVIDPGVGFTTVAANDFDGDGIADFLIRNAINGETRVWTMNGGTVVNRGIVKTMDPSVWQIVGTGDFDGDGKADILWRNTITADVQIGFMNGVAETRAASIGSVPLDWQVVGVADFDRDGRSDILWRLLGGAPTTGSTTVVADPLQVWMMNGATRMSATTIPATLSRGQGNLVAVADNTGDQRADLIWVTFAGQVVIQPMAGAAPLGGPITLTQTISTDWDLVGAGDINGDRRADLIWRHRLTGEVGVWRMFANLIQSSGNVRVVDWAWTPAARFNSTAPFAVPGAPTLPF